MEGRLHVEETVLEIRNEDELLSESEKLGIKNEE